jgi:hypothetical protein
MTNYKVVYDDFKDKITDPDLLLYLQSVQDEILLSTMNKACTRFKRICKINLADRDDVLLQFNQTLDDDVIDILSETMIEIWLQPYVNNAENLRNRLNTKDFEKISPANLLNAIQSRYKDAHKAAKSRMNEYSFIHGDMDVMKT